MKSQWVLVSQRGRKDDQSEREVRREAVRGQRKEDAMLLFLKIKGPKAKECRQLLKAGKGKKTILP